MQNLHESYPEYGFDEHKGYSTPEHAAALSAHGPCAEHRFSYANVAAVGRPAAVLNGLAMQTEIPIR